MPRDPHTAEGEQDPPPPRAGGDTTREPIRTLLWTAATIRPLDEVAALVSLLRRTGEVPSPADEALRAAAVARPLDEVRQLVLMLNEPPDRQDEMDAALRAVAVGRPIEDVAHLVSILGFEGSEPAGTAGERPVRAATAASVAERVTAHEPVLAPAREAVLEAVSEAGPAAGEPPVVADAQAAAVVDAPEPARRQASAVRTAGAEPPVSTRSASCRPPPPGPGLLPRHRRPARPRGTPPGPPCPTVTPGPPARPRPRRSGPSCVGPPVRC